MKCNWDHFISLVPLKDTELL